MVQMNLYEFFSTLWWPIVVVAAIVALARPMRQFIQHRLSTVDIEAGPAKIKLSGEVQAAADKALEVTSEAVQSSEDADVTDVTSHTSSFYERMMRLLYSEPAAAITESFKQLEGELRAAVLAKGTDPHGLHGARLISELAQMRIITDSEIILIREAARMRNRAAHEQDPIPVGVAANYVELVRQLLISLRLQQGRFEPERWAGGANEPALVTRQSN
jgi:hypothetical protein